MNVLLFCVNYKADGHLLRLIESIRDALESCPEVLAQVHVLDNSQKSADQLEDLRTRARASGIAVTIHSDGTNRGYFSGIPLAQSIAAAGFDCIIYSNVDLTVDRRLFSQLNTARSSRKGVIAPSIISNDDGFDQNPKYSKRLSRSKIERLRWIYSRGWAFSLYMALARAKELIAWKRSAEKINTSEALIYAPHGAFFIFTDKEFFLRLPFFPCFLFGEELFIAEEARKCQVPVHYLPSLIVRDTRHASVSKLGTETHRKLYLASVQFILSQYYQ